MPPIKYPYKDQPTSGAPHSDAASPDDVDVTFEIEPEETTPRQAGMAGARN